MAAVLNSARSGMRNSKLLCIFDIYLINACKCYPLDLSNSILEKKWFRDASCWTWTREHLGRHFELPTWEPKLQMAAAQFHAVPLRANSMSHWSLRATRCTSAGLCKKEASGELRLAVTSRVQYPEGPSIFVINCGKFSGIQPQAVLTKVLHGKSKQSAKRVIIDDIIMQFEVEASSLRMSGSNQEDTQNYVNSCHACAASSISIHANLYVFAILMLCITWSSCSSLQSPGFGQVISITTMAAPPLQIVMKWTNGAQTEFFPGFLYTLEPLGGRNFLSPNKVDPQTSLPHSYVTAVWGSCLITSIPQPKCMACFW